MNLEELQAIAEVIVGLGDAGREAFLAWLYIGLAETILKTCIIALPIYWLVSRITAVIAQSIKK